MKFISSLIRSIGLASLILIPSQGFSGVSENAEAIEELKKVVGYQQALLETLVKNNPPKVESKITEKNRVTVVLYPYISEHLKK